MNREQSMYGYLKESCAKTQAVKIKYFNRTITAGELCKRIENTAGFLQAVGVKKGDSVGIALPNIPEAVIS
ncbi:MAG: AMP-binding protein, partial [Clostridia bacterium]